MDLLTFSLFLLFTQNSIDKKKYRQDEVISALEKEGLGKIAADLRNKRQVVVEPPKPQLEVELPAEPE